MFAIFAWLSRGLLAAGCCVLVEYHFIRGRFKEVLQERTMEIMQQSTKISHLEESLTKLENAKLALEHRCTLQAEQLTTAVMFCFFNCPFVSLGFA